MTNYNHKHGIMLTWCRHVHESPHCFILTKACSCGLELTCFTWKLSKNRLVCKKCRCIGLWWELQAPSNGLLLAIRIRKTLVRSVGEQNSSHQLQVSDLKNDYRPGSLPISIVVRKSVRFVRITHKHRKGYFRELKSKTDSCGRRLSNACAFGTHKGHF